MNAAPKHIHFLKGDLKKYIVTMNTMKAQTSNARRSGYDKVYMIFSICYPLRMQRYKKGMVVGNNIGVFIVKELFPSKKSCLRKNNA